MIDSTDFLAIMNWKGQTLDIPKGTNTKLDLSIKISSKVFSGHFRFIQGTGENVTDFESRMF